MRARRLTAFKTSNQLQVVRSCDDIHHNSHPDERRSKPEREPQMLCLRRTANNLKLFEKESKPRHHKSKAHQCQAGANPGKERPLSSQVITQAGSLSRFRPTIHIRGLLRYAQRALNAIVGVEVLLLQPNVQLVFAE